MKKIPTNENRMTAEAWCAVVHGVAMSGTRLSDWTKLSLKPSKIIKTFYGVFQITFQIYVSNCSNLGNLAEKAMAPHSSTLAWKIPWTEEPGGLHAVHGVPKSRTRLSDFTFMFHFHALEEEMATHSRILAWRIPGTGEPGGLPSMGSHRVGHD